eukprot:CAMPEP_0174833546 /NCGR_PEP_ID=MMETSP1114-20130205/4297_1 /TAXON_ID=312471 /ORGANISM="Neobodo designis, Strain CCAP 1951/1" /LENGTH=927 /DNA_ID=CAMNT_0016067429 /DNA_START=25 /DNA_END=2808 /DNA_ORIENTATION=+
MAAATLFADLRDAVANDNLADAKRRAQRIIVECENDGPEATTLRAEGLFDALCVEVSIGAMESAPANIASLRRLFDTCVMDSFTTAVRKYVEGTDRMRTSTELARQRFSEALAADNHFVLARLGLAVVSFKEGEWKQCFSELKHVVASLGDLAPNIVRVLLGVCAFRLRQFDHARKCLVRALDCDPADPMALLANFALHAHFREAPQAASLIDRLEQVAPTIVIQQKRTDMMFYRLLAKGTVAHEATKILNRIKHTREAARGVGNREFEGYACFQEGRLHQALGNLAAARQQYTDAIRLDPALRASHVHIVEIQRALAGPDVCSQALSDAMRLDPKDPRLLEMATLHCSDLAEHSRAIGMAKLLVESVAKARPEAWTTAAWANRLDRTEFHRLSSVASELRHRLGLRKDGATEANAAVMTDNLTDLEAAARAQGLNLRADPVTVRSVTPHELPFWYNYALLNEVDHQARSRDIYVMLVKRAPSEPASYARLVQLAERGGRPCEALRWAKLFGNVNSDPTTAAVLTAWVLKSHGMLSESLTTIRNAAKASPNEALALCSGSLYLADSVDSSRGERKLSMALNGFAYALDKDSHNVLAAHGAACCLASQGKQMHVAGLLERVAEIDCNVSEMKRGIVDHRFNVLVETRAYRNAIAALADKPDPSRLQRCALATCYSAISEHQKAIEVLESALAEQPKDATVSFYLTFALLQAVFDVITRRAPVTAEDGEVAQQRLRRAIEASKYAVGVKPEDQRAAVKQIIAFVGKGSITRAIDRRVNDYQRERADALATDDAWRRAASKLQGVKEETLRLQREKEAETARLRREASQNTYQYQQQMMFQWTAAGVGASGQQLEIDAADTAESQPRGESIGSKRARSEGLEATFAALGAEVSVPDPTGVMQPAISSEETAQQEAQPVDVGSTLAVGLAE